MRPRAFGRYWPFPTNYSHTGGLLCWTAVSCPDR